MTELRDDVERAIGRPLSEENRQALIEAQQFLRENPPTRWELLQLSYRVSVKYPIEIRILKAKIAIKHALIWMLGG